MPDGYTNAELEALMTDMESELIERKSVLAGSARERIRESICAFANDVQGHARLGVVFLGLEDDGSPSGMTISEQVLATLADMKTDGNILPQPTISVDKHTLPGGEVASITVWPSDSPPVRYAGRIWVRIGPRRGLASAQDERILNERRKLNDAHYDILPVPGARLEDFNLRRFEQDYLPAAFSREVLAANDRSLEERLAALRMIVSLHDPRPTMTGLLVLADDPQHHVPGAYIQFLRIGGEDLTDPILDSAVCRGDLKQLTRELGLHLRAHNRIAVDFRSGPTERRYPDYPIRALEELTNNAIMHRAYEGTNAPIHVYWYDDRIEITSPGGPSGNITVGNFGQPGLVDYRNPNLAEAMRVLNLVQRYGVGLLIARQELRDNGQHEPEFDVDAHRVRCIVWKRKRPDAPAVADRSRS